MIAFIAAPLLSISVTVARIEGPNVISDAAARKTIRVVRRIYRREANIRLRFHWRRFRLYETGNYNADVRQLSNYLEIYREKYKMERRTRLGLLITPPLTDGKLLYAGGAAERRCIGNIGFAAVSDTERGRLMAPTLFAHELAHQLSAAHTSSLSMMNATALSLVPPTPKFDTASVYFMRSCLSHFVKASARL